MLFHPSPLSLLLPISMGAESGTNICSPLQSITYIEYKEKQKLSLSSGIRAIYKLACIRRRQLIAGEAAKTITIGLQVLLIILLYSTVTPGHPPGILVSSEKPFNNEIVYHKSNIWAQIDQGELKDSCLLFLLPCLP